MPDQDSLAGSLPFLAPMLALILWTGIIWLWMYALRLPAFRAAGIKPDEARHPGSYADRLPPHVRSAADNYNHLHEQPTLFYALMAYIALTGGADALHAILAWAYVGLRVIHSFIQIVIGKVMLRFSVFTLASLCLFFMAGREAVRLVSG